MRALLQNGEWPAPPGRETADVTLNSETEDIAIDPEAEAAAW